jgi:hypothetical protein
VVRIDAPSIPHPSESLNNWIVVNSTGARFLTTGDPLGYGVRVDADLVGIVAVIDGAGELLGPGLGLGSSGARVQTGGSVGASTTDVGDSLATAQPADTRRSVRNRHRGARIIRCTVCCSTCIEVW